MKRKMNEYEKWMEQHERMRAQVLYYRNMVAQQTQLHQLRNEEDALMKRLEEVQQELAKIPAKPRRGAA
jgi:glutamate 5-kinase